MRSQAQARHKMAQCRRCARFFKKGRRDQVFCSDSCRFKLWAVRHPRSSAPTVSEEEAVRASQQTG